MLTACSGVVDLVFAIDKSGSITREGFAIVQTFINKV